MTIGSSIPALDAAAADLAAVDLADPGTFIGTDLTALWGRFRAERPVHWNAPGPDRPGFWAVSRYEDAVAVYKDSQRFTSARGNVLATLLQGHDSASGKMLAVTDGERHREIRKLMLTSFSPRVLGRVAEQVRARTRRLFEGVVGRGPLDFAADVADHIPINTIGDLMNVPQEDRQKLVDWNTQTLSRDSAEHDEFEELLARNEILLYFSALAAERRRKPGDDVISAMVNATDLTRPLSEDEIVFNCYSLILGADESSRMSSIGAVLELSRNPEQWNALINGDVAIETAAEEVLRWTTPAMHFGRRAITDVVLRDQVIRSGDIMTMWNTAANYDGAVFADPERFDLARTPNRHIAFGYGPHFCLGAFLGRTHVAAVLESLRDLVAEIRLTGEPKRLWSNFVYGYSSLPVELKAK
ncbi:cytochrome P450 [Dactylosporangium matsuzakiense]|uniref:Cytochrome P450 n=1 Tax=Dactylosporangium matsuzakiense TaxID=53360 RepID=A0A9W6KJE3_9ACTN|nr:cytochrome P450 [Dactylosporangium matsuzakiense]UWZ42477.1 cytochrome P450 [Dactylosporangium matsuzakiense]GLL00609.1 cytochrome P450 [Dactylosporangium matsuzakiense]